MQNQKSQEERAWREQTLLHLRGTGSQARSYNRAGFVSSSEATCSAAERPCCAVWGELLTRREIGNPATNRLMVVGNLKVVNLSCSSVGDK